jgi:hypothetical protein
MDKTNLNILVLEDEPGRWGKFVKNMSSGNNLVIVDKVEAAIAHLKEGGWNFLFLDHDLGGEILVESGPGTGYEVACWLEENQDMTPEVVIIHSLNSNGVDKMKMAVKEAYVIPGSWEFSDLLENWDEVSRNLEMTDRRLPLLSI